MHDAEQEAGQHQPHRRFRIDTRAAGTIRRVAVSHCGTEPGQVEHAVHACQNMVIGYQVAQRPRHQKLALASLSAAQHDADTQIVASSSESESRHFFNSPRVHWMRNALSYVPKAQQSMVSAALRQAFIQPDRAAASQTLRHVADQLRPKWPKLGAFIDESEADVLAHMDFPAQHRTKIHSTNPLERLNKEVKRRADVVGIFPNEGAIVRLIGAVLLEANDEWQLQHRYMQTEPMAELTPPLMEAITTQFSTVAA
jgi:hypothetical protein